MPEIKHQFTAGKMNKDLDERLVPNGEYRDALNIQVSTSEGSDVGTVQNILGNNLVAGQTFIPGDAICVGSISDEKNDQLYWFITSFTVDMILRADATGIDLVFIDVNKDTLKFSGKIITGINIVDDMLFWTDNINEPRKINVQRSILGSFNGSTVQTKLLDNGVITNNDVKERHITVIKRSPTRPLVVDLETSREYGRINGNGDPVSYTGIFEISDDPSNTNDDIFEVTPAGSSTPFVTADLNNVNIGDNVKIFIPKDSNGNTSFELDWMSPSNVGGSTSTSGNAGWVGTDIVISEFGSGGIMPQLPILNYRIKGVLTDWTNDDNLSLVSDFSTQNPTDNTGRIMVEFTVSAITGDIPDVVSTGFGYTNRSFAIDLFDVTEKLYEFKFPRFSYRYKYEDGEYSTFAPFTEVAFAPGSFDYYPKKGYNLGMTNTAISITLSNYIPNDIPKDVIEVDILYKEEDSPNIYSVETIRYNEEKTILSGGVLSNNWEINSYKITDETVGATLPSNQLLRPWDNVPKKALGQEITGNRIVYANYLQGLDLSIAGGEEDYYPNFNHTLTQYEASPRPSLESIKSLREYQLGVVFIDKYGRETPILSNPTGTFKIEKAQASSANRLKAGFVQPPVFDDENIQYFKFFIKETSGEYYNLAMDRFYDAGDGNRWLSFPSSDRNKVDTDTFLILKKATESSSLILDPARYKILAIENEAPDFIKIKRLLVETNSHVGNNTATSLYYTDSAGVGTINNPVRNNQNLILNYDNFEDSTGADLHEIDDGVLYMEFGIVGDTQRSKRYEINKITKATSAAGTNVSTFDYFITLKEKLGADVDFISNDTSGINITGMAANSTVRFFKYTVKNAAEYDGRFFAKIYADNLFEVLFEQVDIYSTYSYTPTLTLPVYSMFSSPDQYSATHIGMQDPDATGAPDPTSGYYKYTNFRQFASYFRNYVYANDDEGGHGKAVRYASSTPHPDAPMGRFRFGATSDIGSGSCGGFSNIKEPRWVKEYFKQTGPGNGNPGSNPGPGDLWWVPNASTSGFSNSCGMGQWSTYKENWGNWHGHWGNMAGAAAQALIDVEHVREQEIWFIDYGSKVATLPTNDLDWANDVSDTTDGQGLDTSSSTDFSLELGFGPLFNETTYSSGSIGTYWSNSSSGTGNGQVLFPTYDVGSTTSTWYNDQDTIDIIDNLGGGFQWRWKEDPIKTNVYTNSTKAEQNLVRYAKHGSGNDINSGAPYGLNPNFTKNHTLTCTPALDPASSWIPSIDGVLGPIANGHSIEINSYTHLGNTAINTSATTMEDYFIYLDTDTGSGVSSITNQDTNLVVGMIVVSYDDGAKVLNGTFASVPTDPYLAIKSIETGLGYTKIGLTGYVSALDETHCFVPTDGQAIKFEQPLMNGHSPNQAKRISWHLSNDYSGDLLMAIGYTMEWVIGFEEEGASEDIITTNPAIWETEPKEDTGLDIYYEISGYNAVKYNHETIRTVLPTGSTIIRTGGYAVGTTNNLYTAATVVDNTATNVALPGRAIITMDTNVSGLLGVEILTVTRPDGSMFQILVSPQCTPFPCPNVLTSQQFLVADVVYGYHTLNWYNCYTFFNGVESDRIRDNFNLPQLTSGVKVSTTLQGGIEEEHRKYGLIYSGIYNSNSRTNNLNQFIAAEKITKDINPIYGSIQKLHSRDSDLVTLCEDKCLKILANKDAVYNADGNPQLTANENVLGQTIPFSGEFGISKNPESFASESYRVYFTDKVRGAVMRLSKDGLTPISMHGMRDWFKDNLRLSDEIIGSHDDNKDEYNLTLKSVGERQGFENKSITFKEDVRGWVSFKSFVPEIGISMASNYYTMQGGKLYTHHDENVNRNQFYGIDFDSTIDVVLNDGPGAIKTFHTLDYEGSQSRISLFATDANTGLSDAQPYNLTAQPGWSVSSIITDQQEGNINEFIEKEGKWFNYIKGIDSNITLETDFGAFDIQGIGIVSNVDTSTSPQLISFDNDINTSLQVGDVLYWESTSPTGGFNTISVSDIEEYGTVNALTATAIFVDITGTIPTEGDYIMFTKNHIVNTSSLVGYFASIRLENNAKDKVELFSIGSEITESSK